MSPSGGDSEAGRPRFQKSILVIYEEPSVQDMLMSLFGEEGFRVIIARTGGEGMKVVASAPPDFVLADHFLPDCSGVELKKRIRRLAPNTRVVVASSFTIIRSSDDVLRFGSSDFVVDQREILDLVEAAGEDRLPVAPLPTDDRLTRCLIDTVDVLTGLIELDDPFFGGNSHITMEYARAVAEEMKLPRDTVDEITLAALLHDIGRVGVKQEILNEAAKISESQFNMIKAHCEHGAKIFEHVDFPWKVKPIIIHHHERYDGKGYPGGLKGREIPLGARILAVVDAFAAMTANRPYRKSMGKEEAVRELHRNVGTQFDPEVVEVFSRILDKTFFFRGFGAKPQVLMVDDEIDYLTLLKLKLVNEGFDVLAVDNAREALKIALKEKPDLVVADVVMPEMDGVAMFRKMKAEGETADIPLIFLSGKEEVPMKVEALHLGAEDYLVKPIDFKELAARIRNIIRRDARRRKVAGFGPVPSGVVGDLRNLGVPEIVQTLHLGLKTAGVTIKGPGDEEGRLYFVNGRMRHAAVGDLAGEEAFYRILRWQEGGFVIAHGQTTEQRTIVIDEMQLILEGVRRMDEEKKEKVPE